MQQIYGHFREQLPSDQESLTIVFSPARTSRQDRWRNNGRSADFLGDYFAAFFPGTDGVPTQTATRAEIKSAISFIANELLENAVKFHYDPVQTISISLQLNPDDLVFKVANTVDPDTLDRFNHHIHDLLNEDPQELLIRTIEKNAASNSTDSGLGLITMLTDYGAKLGWRFETVGSVVIVTTMVELGI